MAAPDWWKNAICYQIYPRSFADSNGDGVGDIPGIIDKLDYLQWLGVNALWISPLFPSPNLDWGYDAVDYLNVAPDYGTLDDVDQLIAEAHRRDIRLLFDFVPNHTSDQHPWFRESKSSRDNPYRDWYIWRDGKNGSYPNNWESIFGGSAWTHDPTTDQYFYHYFLPEQPDLNWRNPEVKEAMFSAMRFWLDRGVDGFRLDAIGYLYEAKAMPDTVPEYPLEDLFINARVGVFDDWTIMEDKLRFQANQPEMHPLLREMRSLVDEFGDRVLLGEAEEIEFYGTGHDELHSVFNFGLPGNLDADHLRSVLLARTSALPEGAWDANTASNHDRRRSYTVFKNGQHDDARPRLVLALIMFLRGTPVFYYGEEIGMENLRLSSLDAVRDTFSTRYYDIMRGKRRMSHEEAFEITVDFIGRDGCRTPMQWDATPNAGFSPDGVKTWLPVHPNYAQGITVADQKNQPDSMLMFYRELVHLRKTHPALRTGTLDIIPAGNDVLAFWRTIERSERIIVILNLSDEYATFDMHESEWHLLYSHPTIKRQHAVSHTLHLAPHAIVLAKVAC